MIRKTVIYSGNVQGVGFRATARDLAKKFVVTGTVRNLPNGQVEVIAEGDLRELEAFLKMVDSELVHRIGQNNAFESVATGEFDDFSIAY